MTKPDLTKDLNQLIDQYENHKQALNLILQMIKALDKRLSRVEQHETRTKKAHKPNH